MDMALDAIVPESLDWRHTDEGPECVHKLSLHICLSEVRLSHTVIREQLRFIFPL